MATAETLDAEPKQDAKTVVQTAEFEEACDAGPAAQENLAMLLDIQMPITVVLGKTEVPFRRLLQLGPGSVLELDQAVGQPADLYVQGVRLATGDVVVVHDHYGLRIREVIGAAIPAADAAKPAAKKA